MKRHNDQKISEVLSEFVNRRKVKPKIYLKKIEQLWFFHMGKTISQYTGSIKLVNREVHLYLTSPSLRKELSLSKEKIKNLFNTELGEEYVKDVKFF